MGDPVDLPGCIAIDAFRKISPCACDFLCCAEKTLADAASRSSLAAMVEFFLASDPDARAQGVAIVGHGLDGELSTGHGDFKPGDPFISVHDPASWAPLLELTKETGAAPPLTLVGCWTGASEDGRNLLNTLSDALKTTVKAPTGLVVCDLPNGRLSLQDGAEWNVSAPGQPAGVKGRVQCLGGSLMAQLRADDGEWHTLARDAFRVTHVNGTRVPEVAVDAMLESVNLATPHVWGGVAAAETGDLTIQTPLGDRRFLVYGNTLLKDEQHCTFWYCTGPAFPDLLTQRLV